ncbi:MAG: DedA family protein [Gemmatimonadales bacterium]|jgi:membrane protein DedA with SNARE-associated domain
MAVYAAVGGLAAVENVFPPVPADTAVGLGAFLSHRGPVVATGVFAVTWSANVASAILVYGAGRRWGRSFFRGRLGRRLLSPRSLGRIERMYDRYGGWGVFLSRFVPALRAIVPPFAGVAGLTAPRALIPIAVASGLWYGVLTLLIATFAQEIEDVVRLVVGLNWAGLGIVVIVVATMVTVYARRRQRLRNEATDAVPEERPRAGSPPAEEG